MAPAGHDARVEQLRQRLTAASESERLRLVVDLVREHATAVLGGRGHGDGSSLGAEQPFKAAGFDSLAGIELRNALTRATGVRLPATAIFDHPTPAALAASVLGRVVGGGTGGGAPVMGDLQRLEQSVLSLSAETTARDEISVRLRALLAHLDNSVGAGEDQALTDTVEDASDDELFDLLDDRLETP
ncbi:hypothetical protein E0L36_06990 [Streptomyces sp. AJS327]|nr:hypothetical protein [Streptomyces sp. AJS327]